MAINPKTDGSKEKFSHQGIVSATGSERKVDDIDTGEDVQEPEPVS
jgi:hypothetical protein